METKKTSAETEYSCPVCKGALKENLNNFLCSSCGKNWKVQNRIPLLFWKNEWEGKRDVTDEIKAFYEQSPFPNYDDLDSAASLREKASKGIFARLLDEQLPYDAKILEAGCGTGQLSNFLATTWGRAIIGADLCLNSLKLAQEFKEKNSIDNVQFVQMNLFKPAFEPESFDAVISNGVLHHTSNPRLAFETISKLVKRGGYIIIGLYNSYGRLQTDARCLLFKITNNRFASVDPHLREKISDRKKRAWFLDQYKNPHESKHTMDEVLQWFDSEGFEFMNGIPKLVALDEFAENEELFTPHPRGTKMDHFLVQMKLVFTGGKEGGFFIMIGKKK